MLQTVPLLLNGQDHEQWQKKGRVMRLIILQGKLHACARSLRLFLDPTQNAYQAALVAVI
jgi:hypothetical protein